MFSQDYHFRLGATNTVKILVHLGQLKECDLEQLGTRL